VDGETRGEFVRQNQVVADGRADIDEAASGRETADQVDEDFFFFGFVDIALLVTSALLVEELILIDANAVIESVNQTLHESGLLMVRRSVQIVIPIRRRTKRDLANVTRWRK
jgi:hypothetical protein